MSDNYQEIKSTKITIYLVLVWQPHFSKKFLFENKLIFLKSRCFVGIEFHSNNYNFDKTN
jgi:hypothetical protein